MARPALPLAAVLATLACGAAAQTAGESFPVPVEIEPFVEPGTRAFDFLAADLDGDGREDGLLVLEEVAPRDPEEPRSLARVVVLLGRTADGTLRRAARNDRALYHSDWGGAFGDPWAGIDVFPRGFTLRHYGGSAWRWSVSTSFEAIDAGGPWRLVRISTTSFHALDPQEPEEESFEAPAELEPVDFRDFDLEAWPERYRR